MRGAPLRNLYLYSRSLHSLRNFELESTISNGCTNSFGGHGTGNAASIHRFPARNSTRDYMTGMEISAFEGKILRLIRKEIQYELEYSPPSAHIPEFSSFKVDERPGEQFIRLDRKYGEAEDVKVEVTMFDGSVPVKKAGDDSDNEDDMKLHMTIVVDIFKRGSINVLEFVCSAWPDTIEIRKVFIRGLEQTKDRPYLGPDFKELDDEMQDSLYDFLEARGVDDNLAVFLHRYMINKDKVELLRWMEKVNSYFQKSGKLINDTPK